jgi:hypothetical protein
LLGFANAPDTLSIPAEKITFAIRVRRLPDGFGIGIGLGRSDLYAVRGVKG